MLILAGCNGAVRLGEFEVAYSLGFPPDQPSLSSTHVGPEGNKRMDTGASVLHTYLSDVELEATNNRHMMLLGLVVVIGSGVLQWWGNKTAWLVFGTWAPKALAAVGAGTMAWYSLSGMAQAVIVGGIVIWAIASMHYGSVSHNNRNVGPGKAADRNDKTTSGGMGTLTTASDEATT